MWETGELTDSDLRQGDLVLGLFLPKVRMPVSFVAQGGERPTSGHAVVDATARDFVVVSQCCTVEKSKYIALAPIRGTKPMSADELRVYDWDLLNSEQPGDFAYSSMRLDPVPEGVIPPSHGGIVVIDFEQTISVGGNRDDIVARRRARMTVEGRRQLRTRLAHFWSRPEAADEAELERHQGS